MVACLVGPGPEEVIFLPDFDFLMSSFCEGLFALCTSLNNGDGLKVETRTPLSQRRRVFGTDITKTWRDRMHRIGRLRTLIADISHLVGR